MIYTKCEICTICCWFCPPPPCFFSLTCPSITPLILLQRFEHSKKSKKISSFIPFPLELDMKPFMSTRWVTSRYCAIVVCPRCVLWEVVSVCPRLEKLDFTQYPYIWRTPTFLSFSTLYLNTSLKPLFQSSQKQVRSSRCEYLHLIKKNSQRANRHCEFFLIRCKHSQRAANQFLRWLEKRL